VKTIGSGSYDFSCDMPTAHPAITKDEFLYTHSDFPQCHSASIVETRKGDLICTYFGGKHERNPDVCIWVSIKKKGSDDWSAPILAADGVFKLGTSHADIAGITAESTPAEEGPIKSQRSMVNGQRSTFNVHRSTFNVQRSTFNVQRSTFNVQYKRKACWNPVICEMPDGELWLFFKIGLKVSDWTGWLTKSRDGGRTWSDKEPLPKGFLGPIKNKPLLLNGRLLCPSSTEDNGWKFHMEIYDIAKKEWKYIGPIAATLAMRTEDMRAVSPAMRTESKSAVSGFPADKAILSAVSGFPADKAIASTVSGFPADKKDDPEAPDAGGKAATDGRHPIDCIQPSILQLGDGRLQVLMRSRNGRIATSFSADNGDSWTDVTLLNVPNNQSGTDAVTLSDGRHVLIYNNFETLPATKKGVRTPLSIALSDDGTHWRHVLTLEDSPISQYSYPAIIQGRDGRLHCAYTWRRLRICYKEIDPRQLR